MTAIEFEPLQFLKAHSKDRGDLSTQIWDCFFSKNGNELVTCGGNSVCIIETSSFECEKLKIKKYYAKDPREMFLTVAETYVSNTWIVAAAGARSEVHLIDPIRNLTFKTETVGNRKKNLKNGCAINNILFHPDSPSAIICSANDGEVYIIDLGSPTYPDYVTKFQVLQQFSLQSEIFSTIFQQETNLFLSATNKGLVCFTKSYEVYDLKMPSTSSPQRHTNHEDDQLVDSVQNVGNGFVAVKCALHGKIYICNMNNFYKETQKSVRQSTDKEIRLLPSLTLKWSDTDNYFMSIGYNEHTNLLYCGDDEGCIWMYRLPDLTRTSDPKKVHDPSLILTWPEVIDKEAAGSKKINLDVYDIVINKVAMHPSAQYLVSITSNNYICVWRNERR